MISMPDTRKVETATAPTAGTANDRATAKRAAIWTISIVGIAAGAVTGILTEPPTLWGLMPMLVFLALTLLGTNILLAVVVTATATALVLMPAPAQWGDIAISAVANPVTLLGVVTLFGGAVGEVLTRTDVARVIVSQIMRLTDAARPRRSIFAIMLACSLVVASLGSFTGSLAIAAPLVIPIAASLGYTRSATAAMMFLGGGAGLALAPFAGANIAIMTSTGVGYLDYLLIGALPLVAISLVTGLVAVPRIQRKTSGGPDDYSAEDYPTAAVEPPTRRANIATIVFLALLTTAITASIVSGAGLTVPLIALPVFAVVTALVGGLSGRDTARTIARGMWRLRGMMATFLLLSLVFVLFDLLQPFQVIIDAFGPRLVQFGPFGFSISVALLGWVGIPGATAAQVLLIDQVFGSLAQTAAVTTPMWILVLLFGSKADTYGPLPNPNMMGAMGLARSSNMRSILLTGWSVLAPSTIAYFGLVFLFSL
ncbi:permease [Streptomyces sp. UH6]|uniref:permease n=1 Tax=Streptomyces sp. UH6 TaxID=2748379 RepID=UPI0015D490B2|nr:permease [Streptomyces sp. UH6]NYV72911.1 permease [Streptomyces sp. UH6]